MSMFFPAVFGSIAALLAAEPVFYIVSLIGLSLVLLVLRTLCS